jgi:hypothetical protein
LEVTPRVRSASFHARRQPVDHRAERHAAVGVGLGVEEDLGMGPAVGLQPAEIGQGQVLEVGLGEQDARALVIDVQEVLQVGERVGGADLVHRLERQDHPVALGQLEHQLGLEAALDVHVQLGLGQAADEGFEGEIGHEGIMGAGGQGLNRFDGDPVGDMHMCMSLVRCLD